MALKTRKKPKSPDEKNIKYNYFVIEGTRYRTLLNKKFRERKNWEAPDPSKIISYIPGTIKEVFVKEGQRVKEGDPLVTLEAMKMRNVIASHEEGNILKVNVSKGERVPKGHLLIHLG